MDSYQNIQVKQLSPEKKLMPLKGLYLDHNLVGIAEKIKRPLVYANYVTDKNDVIAVKDSKGNFQIPKKVKNSDDWGLYQELIAQADVFITATSYLKRFSARGKKEQNIINQFSKNGEYEYLGDWRLNNGYKSRNPDMAIVSRSLDFTLPKEAIRDRKVIVFTTNKMSNSSKAHDLEKQGVVIYGAGEKGVDGKKMINILGKEFAYRVIKMATGPRVLKLLLDSGVLDRLYITQVQIEIKTEKPEDVQTVLLDGSKIKDLKEFVLTESYFQEKVVTDNGSQISQKLLVYDHKRLIVQGL